VANRKVKKNKTNSQNITKQKSISFKTILEKKTAILLQKECIFIFFALLLIFFG